MDDRRFDAMAMALAGAGSRRTALKGLGAGVLAGLLGVAAATEAQAARCRGAGRLCREDANCCSKICDPTTRRCACPDGLTACRQVCCEDGTVCLTAGGGTCCTPTGCPAGRDGDPCGTLSDGCGGTLECGCKLFCSSGGRCQTCFIAGTRVAMADGTSRPIELVAKGDLVLGHEGRVNRVVGLDRTVLGGRLLYAFNDGPFFVTAEHPFLTEAGWKAIDPAATARENPRLAVAPLRIGDRLLALAAARVPALAGGGLLDRAETRLTSVALTSLVGRPGDPRLPLYNLLLDGDNTYFADELLAHNKG